MERGVAGPAADLAALAVPAVVGARRLGRRLGELVADANRWFVSESVSRKQQRMRLSFDMRYVGQNFELSVPVSETRGGAMPVLTSFDKIRRQFLETHTRFYGFCSETDPVEIVNLRLTAIAGVANLGMAASTARPVWFDAAGPVKTPIFDRSNLRAGQTIIGPAIIDQFDSTTVLYPRDRLRVDDALNLKIELSR